MNNSPSLLIAEPVLMVPDVVAAIQYWQDVIGFPDKWVWGDPVFIGAVSWTGVNVQFYKHPELAERSKGNAIWMRVHEIDALYDRHQRNGAEIVAPLELQEYGLGQYTLRDLNGYYIHFASPWRPPQERLPKPAEPYRIVRRRLTPEEAFHLSHSVGWTDKRDDEAIVRRLEHQPFSLVAEAGGKAIGALAVVGDGVSFYYLKDVMVLPEWQRRGVGSALMLELTRWLDEEVPSTVMVGLYCADYLAPLYRRFGFTAAHGMIRHGKASQLG